MVKFHNLDADKTYGWLIGKTHIFLGVLTCQTTVRGTIINYRVKHNEIHHVVIFHRGLFSIDIVLGTSIDNKRHYASRPRELKIPSNHRKLVDTGRSSSRS